MQCLQLVDTHMDEILNTSGLQVFCTSWSTSYNKHGATIEVLEGRDSILSILIVTGTNNHDVSTSLEGGINTFLYSLEAQIVDNLIACSSEEVA